jgi:hypothetical protein
VRAILADSQAMLVKGRVSPVDPLLMAKDLALLLRGVDIIDHFDLVHIPFLHTHVHDVAASFDAGGLSDILGPIGDLEVGTVLSGGLSVFSLFITASNFAKAKEMEVKAEELHAEARRLDGARLELEAVGRRIVVLCVELKDASYELFKWTVVGEECARLRREETARLVPRLPRWIAKGLLRKASELWRTIQKSPFSVASAAAQGD